MYNDDTNLRIICFTDDQARLLAKIKWFEVNMTFKRVNSDIHEVVLVTKDGPGGSVSANQNTKAIDTMEIEVQSMVEQGSHDQYD